MELRRIIIQLESNHKSEGIKIPAFLNLKPLF